MYVGDYLPGQPVKVPWSTNAKTGAAAVRSVAGSILIYKGSSTTEFISGVTDTANFDALTGIQYLTVDTSNAFFVAHEDYTVVLSGAIIDGEPVNAVLGFFSVLNRGTNVLITPGTISTGPTAQRVQCADITEPAGTFDHRTLYFGYGSAMRPRSAVISTHVITGGKADFTLVSTLSITPTVGDRVLVF